MRHKYDSSVIFLYTIGKEELLPQAFRKKIPYSTISTWRKNNYKTYVGHEFRKLFDQSLDLVKLKTRAENLNRLLWTLSKSWIAMSHILRPVILRAGEDRQTQAHVLRATDVLKQNVGLVRALKLMGISRTKYYQWSLEARFQCFDSFTQLCVKRHPQQLGLDEILRIKRQLTDPAFDHWPIVSIASDALRKEKVVASLYSWYKYAKLFGIYKKLIRKQRKTEGLIATVPNEYLHVDTTFYELLEGTKVCISFVMDNYSKMILGYHIALRNTFELVRRSLKKALQTIHLQQTMGHSFLVTDGGAENNNKYLDAFIKKLSGHKITKIRALKDIRFSNSPVEAVHRSIKGRYLRNRKFDSIRSLDNYLKWAVNDYNFERPHYKHRPRTPSEVYFGIKLPFDVRTRVKGAIASRVASNKCAKCIQCRVICRRKEPLAPKSKSSTFGTT
jgi:hypothetical protein